MDPLDLIREGKIKRFFRAKRKLDTPGLVSHITQRAAGKEPLFLEDADYLSMMGLLKEIAGKYSLKVFAFCLMPNHIHLLLSPEEKNLYDAMRDLFSRYAMGFNRKYERKGHLFGSPYRQALCLNDSYLLAASLYIHLNPLRAGLVGDPAKFRWSSCRLYHQEDAPAAFVDPDYILDLLSGDDRKRKRQYRLLLGQSGAFDIPEVLEKEDAIEGLLSRLAGRFPSIFSRVLQKKKIAASCGLDLPGMEELEGRIEALGGELFSRKPESREARKYLAEQLVSRGFKRKEIARMMGISRKSVYNIVKSAP